MDQRRGFGGHRSCAGNGRGRSRPRAGFGDRAPHGVVHAPRRRPKPVQFATRSPGRRPPAHSRTHRMDIRASRCRSLCSGTGAAGWHERPQLQPRLYAAGEHYACTLCRAPATEAAKANLQQTPEKLEAIAQSAGFGGLGETLRVICRNDLELQHPLFSRYTKQTRGPTLRSASA